jgi:hypothetical protein
LTGDIVKVQVGSGSNELQEFHVHSALICQTSQYFINALRGTWVESETRSVCLLGHNVEVFRIYLTWLYNKSFGSSVVAKAKVPKSYKTRWTTSARTQLLIESHLLGEYILDLAFTDVVMDMLVLKTAKYSTSLYPLPGQVYYVWNRTGEGSKLRQLFVDLYVQHAGVEFVQEEAGVDLPDEFLVEVVIGLLKARTLRVGS